MVVWGSDMVPSFLGMADASSCSSISACESDASMDGNDHELECLISFDDDGLNNNDATTEIFTPYPFDRQTREEIENFRQLGLSFGEDWSLQLADEVTCSEEMSIITDFADEGFADPTPQVTASSGFDESDEVKAMRNRLWKQSLKTSMFTRVQCNR
jgi:hypothetical protein